MVVGLNRRGDHLWPDFLPTIIYNIISAGILSSGVSGRGC